MSTPTPPLVVPPRRWLTRVLVPVVLLAGAGGVLAWAGRDWLLPARTVAAQPVLVLAADAAEGPAAPGAAAAVSEPLAQATGWLEPAPYPVYAAGLAPGTIAKLCVLEGSTVKAGDPVAELVRRDAELALDAAKAEAAQAEAEMARMKTEAEAAQADWDQPVERRRQVAEATAKLAGARAEAALLPAQVRAAEAESVAAGDRLARLEKLRGSAAFVEAEWVQARGAAEAKDAALAALKLEAPVRAAAVAEAEAASAAAEEAFRLRIIEKARLAQAAQALASAESAFRLAAARQAEAALRLERMTVRAPSDGVVMRLLKAPGDPVEMGGTMPRAAQVAALYDPAHLQVRVDVPQSLAARVRAGQACEAVFDLLPDRKFKGRVARFVHEADLTKNTVQVKVELLETAPELKPEILARVAFFPGGGSDGGAGGPPASAGTGAQRVYVPLKALVVRHETHGSAWRAEPLGGNAAVARRVELTLAEAGPDGFVRVKAGLQPGDRVVLDPPADLRDGARLKLVEDGRLEK